MTRGIFDLIDKEIEIIDKDEMLSDLKTIVENRRCPIYQEKRDFTNIEKKIYKTPNQVFNIKKGHAYVTLKCVFQLHTKHRSCYVQVYNHKNEKIFKGNSLWGTGKFKTKEELITFIKRLHDIETVIHHFQA